MDNQLIHQAINAVCSKLFDKYKQVELSFACLLAGGHLLIEDKPGLGKTTLAGAISQVFGLSFKRIQFTSDMLPSDVLGVSIFQPQSSEFTFFQGPIFTQLLLADELNRGTPRTQSALLEAMAEQQVSIDGKINQLPSPFFVIATQNPTDDAGTFPLPDSQLDRFMVSLSLGYPSVQAERKLYDSEFFSQQKTPLKSMISTEQLQLIQTTITSTHVSDEVKDYIQSLISQTRENNLFINGLSPRAGLALFRLSQSLAYISSRDFVIPEDVKNAFLPIASHRMRSQSLKNTTESLLQNILDETRHT